MWVGDDGLDDERILHLLIVLWILRQFEYPTPGKEDHILLGHPVSQGVICVELSPQKGAGAVEAISRHSIQDVFHGDPEVVDG